MGVLEWLGAHLLGPFVSLVRAVYAKPRPELKIHDLFPTGGGSSIDFQVVVQNVGEKSARATVTAHVADSPVEVLTPTVELLPSAPSTTVHVRVPRPDLGELVKAFNSDTTLYGRTLTAEVSDGKRQVTRSWREHEYTLEENRERHLLQQRVWRIGRGEATDADWRSERIEDIVRRRNERYQ